MILRRKAGCKSTKSKVLVAKYTLCYSDLASLRTKAKYTFFLREGKLVI